MTSYQVDCEVGGLNPPKINFIKDKFIEKFRRKLLSGSRWAGVRAVVPKGERFTLADAYGSVWAFSIYQSGRPSNSRSVCFSPFYHFGFFFFKKGKNPLLLEDENGNSFHFSRRNERRDFTAILRFIALYFNIFSGPTRRLFQLI